jgi:hypothetical protein
MMLVCLFFWQFFSMLSIANNMPGYMPTNSGQNRRSALKNGATVDTAPEYSIFSLSAGDSRNTDKQNAALREREQLYEAYNQLHTLAQVVFFILQ